MHFKQSNFLNSIPKTNYGVGNDNKRIIPSLAALDVYTATSLMKALKMKGDIASVERVLASVEGRTGESIGGRAVADWPNSGLGIRLQPDTQCYNVAISAAAEQTSSKSGKTS